MYTSKVVMKCLHMRRHVKTFVVCKSLYLYNDVSVSLYMIIAESLWVHVLCSHVEYNNYLQLAI